MGRSWTDVHDEAEHLEHVVSDRLPAILDRMLGRRTTDPHSDAIPGPEGGGVQQQCPSLLACPLDTPIIVARVTEQAPRFFASSKSTT